MFALPESWTGECHFRRHQSNKHSADLWQSGWSKYGYEGRKRDPWDQRRRDFRRFFEIPHFFTGNRRSHSCIQPVFHPRRPRCTTTTITTVSSNTTKTPLSTCKTYRCWSSLDRDYMYVLRDNIYHNNVGRSRVWWYIAEFYALLITRVENVLCDDHPTRWQRWWQEA